ncbi:MAG: hypothetical protein AB7J63_19175 [Vicinamibacterales bacterium]
MRPPRVEGGPDGQGAERESALRLLFHRLNNQLGIILAHAELLEAKVVDDQHRARAAQVVTSALDAMGTIRDIRRHVVPAAEGQ